MIVLVILEIYSYLFRFSLADEPKKKKNRTKKRRRSAKKRGDSGLKTTEGFSGTNEKTKDETEMVEGTENGQSDGSNSSGEDE